MNCTSAYDTFANFYDQYWKDSMLAHLSVLEELVLDQIPKQGKILDVGCGAGTIVTKRAFGIYSDVQGRSHYTCTKGL